MDFQKAEFGLREIVIISTNVASISFQILAFALLFNCTILPPLLPSKRHFVPLTSIKHNNFIYLLFKFTRLISPCFCITNYHLRLINIHSLYSIFNNIFIIFPKEKAQKLKASAPHNTSNFQIFTTSLFNNLL